jgi:acyl carrier protein
MMTSEGIAARICEVMSVVLGVPVRPGERFLRSEHATWDSLKHIELMFAVEEAIEIRFGEEEFATLDSLEALVARARALAPAGTTRS